MTAAQREFDIVLYGATGFVGRALCVALVAKGHRVTAMVRRANAWLPDGVVRWVAPELPDLAPDVAQRLAGIDMVIHAAGRAHMLEDIDRDPSAAFRRVNTEGTLSLALAAASAGVRRFIFVSSIGVSGSQSHNHAFRADRKSVV